MKSTIKDVAQQTGFSAITVSKVLNGSQGPVRISESTVQQIRLAAKQLGYQPNHLARSLRTNKTLTIGFVFNHMGGLVDDNPYYPRLLSGILDVLSPKNYTLSLVPRPDSALELISIDYSRFDGLIWAMAYFPPHLNQELAANKCPLVMVNMPPDVVAGVPTFAADNHGGLQKVVNHLVEMGHKDMAFITDSYVAQLPEGQARANGFLDAAKLAKVNGKVWVWNRTPEAIESFLREFPKVTAVSLFSDTLAGMWLTACRQLGVRVPEDLSVVGFDSSQYCERTVPRLTSVHHPVEEIAHGATNYLLNVINGWDQDSPRRDSLLFDCNLDIRDSVDRPLQSRRII